MATYPKKVKTALNDYFNSTEFDCPCSSCTQTIIDGDLVDKLARLREAVGMALRINSGYRCAAYQEELKLRGYETATGISQHQLGRAADVMCVSDAPLTGVQLEALARNVGFKAVGVGHVWIHVDLRDDKDRRWAYTR